MNDLIEFATSGNNPLILAGALGAIYYFFLRKPNESAGSGLAGWIGSNKVTLLSVLTTLFQHRETLAGFVTTFLANVKSLFVPVDPNAKK